MKTIDMLRAILSKRYAIKILKNLDEGERTSSQLQDSLGMDGYQVASVLKYLNCLAVVMHVHRQEGYGITSFYRISQRGKDILELVKEREIAEQTERLLESLGDIAAYLYNINRILAKKEGYKGLIPPDE